MASHGHAPQESTNRKLLEQLTEQKKRMTGGSGGHRGGGPGPANAGPSAPSTSSASAHPASGIVPGSGSPVQGPPQAPPAVLPMSACPSQVNRDKTKRREKYSRRVQRENQIPPDAAGMTSQQRTALQYAHANSVGYFIPQDSSFGNLILPVLPRYSEK
ncbi:hypothetical protein ACOMHN_053264 [Nucella lapillus]